ncbi:uncharacterized protein LOC143498894 [Brachyhypopomus gauderio]|uniref:uncharacterized protein LOC143498894 n=1 Tax=Brachyhypopomus gauderio TaxID=698409 RepID=UPI0040410045
MSYKLFILVLSFSLKLQDVCSELSVLMKKYNVDYNLWPTIACQHNGKPDWTIRARLTQKTIICDKDMGETCDMIQHGSQFSFTLKNTTSIQNNSMYKCEVYRSSPVPVIIRESEECTIEPNLRWRAPDQGTHHSDASLSLHLCLPDHITWALAGLAILLCLYSLTLTILYIRLRIKVSENVSDTPTYVPMQKNVRGRVPDKNGEYMDMREVHHRSGPIRDVNYNSRHHVPIGLTM